MLPKTEKLLTICIPTYNRAYFLEEVLASLCVQFNEDILKQVNIVISDNASPDNTTEIAEKYVSKYPENIQYFRNPENIGWIKNVIKVTDYARGKYMWLLADDDCATGFSLASIIEIIEKNEFDLMLCRAQFFEKLPVTVAQKANGFESFDGMKAFAEYLYQKDVPYANLNSYFSFYSIIIVRRELFQTSAPKLSHEFERTYFPHSYIIHSNPGLRIILPDNIFVLWRTMNEGYSCSVQLIRDFEEIFDLIEKTNGLKNDKNWRSIKSKCIKAWRINMYLGMLLKKLWVDYKNNPLFNKMYLLYKKVLGVFFNT